MIRQSAYNLLGGVAPAIAAIACTPLILRLHGAEFFGIYSIQTALLVMVGLMDLGISRGVILVTFDPLLNPSGDPVRPFAAGSRLSVAVAGLILVVGLVASAAFFKVHLGTTDQRLSTCVHIVSAALTILTLPSRSMLEIKGRFGRLNVIRATLASAVFIAPLLPAGLYGLQLTSAALYVLGTRIVGLIAYRTATGVSASEINGADPADRAWLRSFARRCGWVGLTNAASLVLTYADRFVLGAMSNATQVAHYVVASEAATKVWMMAGAVQSATTPKVASEMLQRQVQHGTTATPALRQAKRLLFLVVVLPSMLLMLFIEPVFKLWLGSSYDLQVASAARVLIAGVALNSMAQFNFMLLQLHHGEAAGAHLQLVNLLISVVLMATLIPPFGTMGAAAAFSIRLAIDAFATRYLAQLKSNSSDGFSYKELATTLLVLVALLLL